jgi:hypothetical protein
MTGLIATLAALGIVASVMIIGLRRKTPPPDPEWREHAGPGWKMTGHLWRPGSPPRPRWYLALWFGRYPLILLGVVAAALHADGLARSIFIVWIVGTAGLIAFRIVQVRLEVKRRAA